MNLQHKYLPSVVLGLLIIVGIYFIVLIDHTANTATTANTVTFSGEGKVMARPDIAVISFSIVTESTTSKDSQDQNSRRSTAVTDFLKKEGVDEKDIKTVSYNIYPQYNYPQLSRPQISGYQTNQTFEVKVRKLDNVSKILDGIVAAGANQVNNLGLQIDEPEKLKAEARAKALEDARKKAEELEDQVGIKLGKIVNYSEGLGGIPPIPYDVRLKEGMGGGGGPDISIGQNEIVVNVNLTYQIK